MKNRSSLNGWTITGALALGILLTLCLGLVLWLYRPESPVPQPAVVTLIPGPTSTVAPTLTPTINVYLPTATPRPGELAVGLYVQVKGTEGQGLKVRKAPGLDSEMVFLAYDAEIFMLKDGPLQEDGYTWWYLEAPYDSKRTGWTVSDYLEYVASP